LDAENDKVSPPQDADRLGHMLLMDAWSVHDGLFEIVRDYSPTLSGKDLLASLQLYSRLKQIWDSGEHPQGRLSPAYFVSWAEQKRYPLSWAAWAKQEGRLDEQSAVASLPDARRKAIGQRGLATARAALEGSTLPVTVQMPRLSSKLADALNVFCELCQGRKVPMHKVLAAAIDDCWGKSGKSGTASPDARMLATLLLADVTTPSNEARIA